MRIPTLGQKKREEEEPAGLPLDSQIPKTGPGTPAVCGDLPDLEMLLAETDRGCPLGI